MYQVTLEEATRRLSELIHQTQIEDEVILLENNLPIAKIVPLHPHRPRAQRGSAKGEILAIAPDFDAIPEGFEEYLP